MPELPDEVEELYCAPLDEFVARRAALVRALRAGGRREEAALVAKLPKPALAAWAVNQVVRSRPQEARGLWKAGDAVLGVHGRTASGKASGADLRRAIEAQREALAPLADAARGLVTARGSFLGEQAVQSVIETLHAAAVDPASRPDVEAGTLARPLRLAGLGAVPPAPASKRAAKAPGDPGVRPVNNRGSDPLIRAGQTPPAAAGRDSRARKASERAVGRAERARDAAAERVARRRAELEEAEAELTRLEDDLRTAREELDDRA